MKFEEALNAVLKKIEISESDHKDFLDDVETITTEIDKAMEANNSIFKDMLKGLKSTAFYRKDSVIDIPDNMQFLLVFKLPFKVEAVYRGGGLKLMTKVKHPIVMDGLVDVDRFYFLMKANLDLVISKMKPVLCRNDRTFKLSFTFPAITATEEVEVGSKDTIDFSFLPILQFDIDEDSQCRQQFVTLLENRPLKIMSHADMNLKGTRPYLRDTFRLLKMLEIKYSDEDESKLYFVIIASLFDSLKCNISCLGSLFFESFKRIFICERDSEVESRIFGISLKTTFFKNIQKLYRDILYFHLMDSVEPEDMLALFKLS